MSYKRRNQAERKMNDVALELVDSALKSSIKAKYVLFDSWYSSPRMFSELLQRGLFAVFLLKKQKKYLQQARKYFSLLLTDTF